MAKEKTTEEIKETKETKEEKVTENTKSYKVLKNKNFVGFVHPSTRKLVTANEDGAFVIKVSDQKAIDILEAAVDIYEAE